jgi:hypothetical protein
MFYGCTKLTSLPAGLLPATTLATGCYSQMFYQCTALEQLPDGLLPVTTLATNCYNRMFYNCISLVNIGDIDSAWFSARSGQKQASMFASCSAITTPITYANIPSGWK